MPNRIVRVNELIQREVSDILRRHHTAEAVAITIAEVRISPDLRDGRVFVSIVGDAEQAAERFRWLQSMAPEVRSELARRVTLKFLPRLTYVLDTSTEKVASLLRTLDAVEREDSARAGPGHG